MRIVRLAVGLLTLTLAAGPAPAEDEGGGLRGRSTRVGELGSRPASMDDSMKGGAEGLGGYQTRGSSSIDQVRQGNQRWAPPDCDSLPEPDVKMPASDESAAWDEALESAGQRLANREQRWRELETGAVVVRPKPGSDETRAEATRRTLGEARESYADARCELVTLLERARRAGVPAGTLVPHFDRLPEDLQD